MINSNPSSCFQVVGQDHGKRRREKWKGVDEKKSGFLYGSCVRHRGMQKWLLQWFPPLRSTNGQTAAVVCGHRARKCGLTCNESPVQLLWTVDQGVAGGWPGG